MSALLHTQRARHVYEKQSISKYTCIVVVLLSWQSNHQRERERGATSARKYHCFVAGGVYTLAIYAHDTIHRLCCAMALMLLLSLSFDDRCSPCVQPIYASLIARPEPQNSIDRLSPNRQCNVHVYTKAISMPHLFAIIRPKLCRKLPFDFHAILLEVSWLLASRYTL